MLACTWLDSLQPTLAVVSPAVAALVSAIALWVAAQARSISRDEQRTLSALVTSVQRSSEPLGPSASRRTARARKRSSTKGTTST